MFRLISHTADAGVEISAPTLDDLFCDAANGWRLWVCGNRPTPSPIAKQIRLESDDLEDLLVRWLSELNYLLNVEQMMLSNVHRLQVSANEDLWALRAVVFMCHADRKFLDQCAEIKAITYHRLEVVRTGRSYYARVIFDI